MTRRAVHRSRFARILVSLGLLGACKKDPGTVYLSDFDLGLSPRLPANQDAIAGSPDLTLVLRTGEEVETVVLGQADGGSWSLDELDPLEDVRIGLLFEQAGRSGSPFLPSDLIAYGEAGPFSLVHEARDASVLVARFGGIGEIGVLEAGYAALYGALAYLPDGTALLFGGTAEVVDPSGGGTTPWSGAANDGVYRLVGGDEPSPRFDRVATMPGRGRMGATATRVGSEDDAPILVAGGRTHWFGGVAGSEVLDDAFLYDPVTDQVIWQGRMPRPRAQHTAVRLASGRIALVGGFGPGGFPADEASFDLFDPETRVFSEGSTVLSIPSVGFASADLGVDGVIFCGGARNAGSLIPSDACSRITGDGTVVPAVDLPVPLQMLSMAPLGDGGALACGGVASEVPTVGAGDAIDSAWVLDADGWRAIGDGMLSARAGHRAIAAPDGRVVIVGGATRGGAVLPLDVGTAITCPEVYDPAQDRFLALQPCSSTGSGASPTVAWTDTEALVISGQGSVGDGSLYGIIGLGPPL